MASTISVVDTRSTAVGRSPSTTTHTPYFPPFASKKFVCSPNEHSLSRTGLDAVSDQSRFMATMDALAYRIQTLSLYEPSAGQATALIGCSVHTGTPARSEAMAVEASPGRKISDFRYKILYKCTQSIRAGFKRAAVKRGDRTKKSGGASRPPYQCSPQADHLVGQTIESIPGRSVLEGHDVNQYPQVFGAYQTVSSDFQDPTTPRFIAYTSPPPIDFGVPPSNSLPAVSTAEDWNEPADTPMDDNVQSSSPQPTSPAPIPMEVEAGTPSSNSNLAPSSPRAPSEPSMNRELDSSVSEPADTIMRDEEEAPREQERGQATFINPISPPRGSSSLDQDTEMGNEDESTSFTPLRPISISSSQPMEATSASNELDGTSETDISRGSAPTSAPATTVDTAHQEGDLAPTLPTSRLDTAPQSEQPTEVAQNEETRVTQPQIAPLHSRELDSTSTGTATSIDPLPVATPSPTATTSTTGPTTPTLSTRSDLTPERGEPTQTHAARLHQVLGKWGLSKQASRSSQPAASDPEEAEALAFFADLKKKAAAKPPVKEKSKPAPLPSPSEPTPTKGSAARTLMDDIMAGFRGVTKPKASLQQAPPAARPSTRPDPAARNPPRSSLVRQGPSSGVAAREGGPRPAPPHYIGNGSEVSAPSGSAIHSVAPSAVPMPSKVSGPSGRISAAPPSEIVPHKTASEPSTITTGGGQSGLERAIKGTRRVAKAVIKTGLTWQIVQQRAREAQAASDLDQVNAAAPTRAGSPPSLERNSTQPSEPAEEEPVVKRRCL